MLANKSFRKNFFITILLLGALSISSLYAKTDSDRLNKVTLELNKVTLKMVFNQIESQTNFMFVYENDVIDFSEEVSVNVSDVSVDVALRQIFDGKDAGFEINKNKIFITSKNRNTVKLKGNSEKSNVTVLVKKNNSNRKGGVKKTPIYIIDGVFSENINAVNPAEIESISIVKDASSLAMYGSRGVNGVVIVETTAAVNKVKANKDDLKSNYGF